MPDGPDRQPAAARGDPVVPPARLKARPDFVRASGGGRVHSRCLSLQVFRRPGIQDPVSGCRVGLTVTKKVGNAVERNRIKRRFREALRASGLATRPDHDYVIVARRDALSAPFAGLVGEVRRCFGDAASGKSKAGRPRGSGPRRPGPASARGGADRSGPTPHP